ncbi:NAD(+) synthase [Gemmatimonadota bacterium]
MERLESRPPLRVGLVQFKPRKADVDVNLARIRERVHEVATEVDILVFPEACLSGYFLEGGVSEASLSAEGLARALGCPPKDGPDLVLGFYERWRRGLFNSVAYLEPRGEAFEAVHVHRKMFLPTYGVFEEARFVDPGRDLAAFDSRFGRVGLLVCEEIWHSLPPAILALDGAELILVVSASPAREFPPEGERPGNLERWDTLARCSAQEHGVFVGVCQLVGSEGGKVFPGGSVVAGPDGSVLARGPLMEEGTVKVVLEGGSIDRARFETPLLADLKQMLPHLQRALERAGARGLTGPEDDDRFEGGGGDVEEEASLGGRARGIRPTDSPSPDDPSILALDLELVRMTLVQFIRDEVRHRRGFERVVLGVSGGVDSALALFLAVEALGPRNVTGFRMPYSTSSPESLEHGALVLDATGAGSETIDISPSVDAYVRDVDPGLTDMRRGNLAARIRGVTLFDQSARLEALPLGTGNKSERLLGYFTWHADDSPPINPLGDLFKTQVWALARHVGVPDEIVDKPASADLIRGIHDEDELGFSYHTADPILHWFLRGYRPEELVVFGFDEAAVGLVWRRLNSTHWKRELPTVAVLSSTAIGEFYLRPVDY